MEKLKQEWKSIGLVTSWVFRFLAGVIALNAKTYECSIKQISFTVGFLIGFVVIAQVIYEVLAMARKVTKTSK